MAAPDPSDPVATALREVLASRGISRKTLAERVGVSRNTVTSWTTGRYRPRTGHARKLAEELSLPLETLTGGTSLPQGEVEPNRSSSTGTATARAIVVSLAEIDPTPAAEALSHLGRELDSVLRRARTFVTEHADQS